MCDINCIWLFNLLVAVVLILLQQQQHVVGIKQQQEQLQQHHDQHHQKSTYDDISSYAAAAAAKYLRRSSLPHNVVKREIKNVKNTDFISYLNDFNMQDEASIPEDIIDQQHLQDIIEKQQGIQNKVEAIAGNGDVDIIDVNLPYDDSDTDAEVDIILESQRSSERNDDDKTNNNSNSNKKNHDNNNDSEVTVEEEDEDEVDRDKNENLRKTNNRKEILKEKKKLKTNYSNNNDNNKRSRSNNINNSNDNIDNRNKDNNQQQQQKKKKKIKSANNMDYSNQYIYDGDEQDLGDDDADADREEKFEQDIDDDDDGSAEYEKFKTMHEQQQREQQQRQQQQYEKQQQQNYEIKQQQQQNEQMSSTKKLNERKFNNNPDLGNKLANIAATAAAASSANIDNDSDDSYAYDNNHKNYYYGKFHQQQQNQQQQQPLQNPKEDAIGDIEENENQNILKTTDITSYGNTNSNNGGINGNNFESKDFTQIFIPRKMKRHNGAARLEDATNRYTRQQLQQQKSQIDIDEENLHKENVAKISSQEENFKKKYYDILKENSTQDHYHHAAPAPSSAGIAAANPKDFNFYDEHNDREKTYEIKKQTAFEREKSIRRNNKHYGHKTHKKKYKDYLRYSQMMMMTTSTTSTTEAPLTKDMKAPKDTTKENQDVQDLNTLRNKHLEKFKMEKLKTLIPQSPIFLLKQRDERVEPEVKDVMAKIEDPTAKPFYEGQINYFMETDDDDSERANAVRFITKGERVDTNDWYKQLSPVLRNGNKKSSAVPERGFAAVRAGYTPYHHYKQPQQKQPTLHHLSQQSRNHQYHHQQQQKHRQHPHQHLQQQSHHHQQIGKQHSRHHAYQRKMIPRKILISTTPLPPPSRKRQESGDAIRELGHQITDLKDFERYYAKWPHLAKVQSQLHEEELREQQSENYPDYEYEDNDDYWEEQDNKDDNLPPYIRKYNRRNKQLLDLLEGTIAPPTRPVQQLRWAGSKLQPGPRDSSVGSMSVHIDDDYLKEKRKRYHQRQKQIHDLFAQQRGTTTTKSPPTPPPQSIPTYPYMTNRGKMSNDGDSGDGEGGNHNSLLENHLPDEDISISLETNEHDNDYNAVKHTDTSNINDDGDKDESINEQKQHDEIWQREIDIKSANTGNSPITWQMEKLLTSSPASSTPTHGVATLGGGATTTQKPAIFKLPSYPSIAGSFMNRPRSRSAQFAPSSGSEYRRVTLPYLNTNLNNNNINNNNNNFINAGGFVAYNGGAQTTNTKSINGRYLQNIPLQQQSSSSAAAAALTAATTTIKPPTEVSSRNSNNHLNPSSSSSSSVTNSFIYHRVVDASPKLVGAGLFAGGRKQRLPFVAITDRRLETSKKSLSDHQKDFEQNHYPLP